MFEAGRAAGKEVLNAAWLMTNSAMTRIVERKPMIMDQRPLAAYFRRRRKSARRRLDCWAWIPRKKLRIAPTAKITIPVTVKRSGIRARLYFALDTSSAVVEGLPWNRIHAGSCRRRSPETYLSYYNAGVCSNSFHSAGLRGSHWIEPGMKEAEEDVRASVDLQTMSPDLLMTSSKQ